jgi:tetratricopeptide (TPR) repeat protein
MAKRPSKKRRKEAASRKRLGPPGGVVGRLAEAVRQGQSGRFSNAEALARRAHDLATSDAERRAAAAVLAEACLHAGLSSADPLEMSRHLNEALRLEPSSPRLSFYRALATNLLNPSDQVQGEILGSLEAGVAPVPPATRAYARELSRLLAGREWNGKDLAQEDARELRLLEKLLLLQHPPAGVAQTPASAVQLSFLVSPEAMEGQPSRPEWLEAFSLAGQRIWSTLLTFRDAGPAGLADELGAEAAGAGPGPVRTLLQYYQGMAALAQGEEEEALKLWRDVARLHPPAYFNLVLVLGRRARELAEQGRWAEVLGLAGDVPRGSQDRIHAEATALAHDHLGYEEAQGGRWREAARHWRHAMELQPRRGLAQNLALAEEALGRWHQAAEAWRAMVRRRPRKPDHPEFLSTQQVAALWHHAGTCYERGGNLEEALTCMETALKHAPEDSAIRLQRANLLLETSAYDAAEKELDQLLEAEPEDVEGLRLRAALEDTKPLGDAAPFWRRVLAAVPGDPDAREALAASYVRQAVHRPKRSALPWRRPVKDQIRTLEEGLKEVPGHPRLLTTLGRLYGESGKPAEARARLFEALDVAPTDADVAGDVLHELLHFAPRDEESCGRVLEHLRTLPRFLPEDWLDQAHRVLECELPREWFERFVEEALAATDRWDEEDSRASVLVQAYELADSESATELVRRLERRLQVELPASGALELLEAMRVLEETGDERAARKLLGTAAERARRARDVPLSKFIRERDMMISGAMEDVMRFLFREFLEP